MKKWISIAVTFVLLSGMLAGCSKTDSAAAGSAGTESSESSADTGESADSSAEDGQESTESGDDGTEEVFTETDADMFTDRDYRTEYDESSSVSIRLDGDSVTADSDSVRITGTTVTITEEATYVISGSLNDGQIIVNASDSAKLQLVLDGAEINCETSAPLYILAADKVFVTLADGSENTLSNGGTFTAIDDNNIDSVIFSKQDLTLNGTGSLTVTSPAGHGIVSKDDLVITGGSYTIDAESHGIQANDSVRITGDTELVIDAGKDGIHAENDEDASLGFVYISDGTMDIAAEGDGVSAGSYMQIEDGTVQILAGGGNENGTKESSDSWGDFKGGGVPGRTSAPPDEMPGTSGEPGGRGAAGSSGAGGRGGGDSSAGGNGSTGGAEGASSGVSSSDIGNATAVYMVSTDDMKRAEKAVTELSSTDEAAADSDTDTDTGEETDDSSTSMKGLKAAGSIRISGGSFSIDSADDAVHSNASITINGGTFEIATGDDGIHADETLTVTDGTIDISVSYEGLEALDVCIEGGDISLVADDDGLNAAGGTDSSGTSGGRDGMVPGGRGGMGGGSSSSNGSISISGGNLHITASGDGIDANGSLTISGGYTVVEGPTQGDTSTLDYDTSATITGGTFIGTGGSGMAQSFSASEQGVVAVSAGTQESGTTVTLTDQDGEELLSSTPALSFDVVILSSPDLVSGERYTLTVGSSSEEVEAN